MICMYYVAISSVVPMVLPICGMCRFSKAKILISLPCTVSISIHRANMHAKKEMG